MWGNALETHLHPLCLLQNKIIRIINFAHYKASANPIYIQLDILPFYKVIIQRVAIVMYKFTHNMLPEAMSELYCKNNEIHTYNTRQTALLHVPSGTHTRNFCYRSVLIWNELTSRGVDHNVSLLIYKRKLKSFLQNNHLNIGYSA